MSTSVDRYIASSAKIKTDDLNWEEARQIGLTHDERFALTYFADIESQTIRYQRTLLSMKIAFRPDVAAFLTTWSYEEYFHGHTLERLLRECGYPLGEDRVEQIRKQARFNEWFEAMIGPPLSRLFSNQFPAVYMSFGAIQEMTTLRGYESLARSTRNPVLRTICDRIAKQERRHFAWYYNNARERLAGSRLARRLTRTALRVNWAPVGAGVKSGQEVRRLFSILFPGEQGRRLVEEIDAKIGALPGLDGIRLMRAYFGHGTHYPFRRPRPHTRSNSSDANPIAIAATYTTAYNPREE